MISPLVAQLIAEERIDAGRRAAENARLVRLIRGDQPSVWARAAHRVGGTAVRLRTALHHDRATTVAPCV